MARLSGKTQGYGAPGILSADGLQSAGGCAQQIVEARNAKMIAVFIGLLLGMVVSSIAEILSAFRNRLFS